MAEQASLSIMVGTAAILKYQEAKAAANKKATMMIEKPLAQK
jgi:hypothetical protein